MFEEPVISHYLSQEDFSPRTATLPEGEQFPQKESRRATASLPERHHRGTKRTTRIILLAEDSDDLRDVIAMHLRRAGYKVVECRNGSELVRALTDYLDDVPREMMRERYDLLISDIRMPGISGLSVAEAATDCEVFPPTILITAFGDEETHQKAARSGVVALFDKPFDVSDLLQTVRQVFAKLDEPGSPADLFTKWPYPPSDG